MTNIYGKELTEQGERIVTAIQSGLAAMTPARWQEEAEKAAEFEDEGEWFAPEFAAAREATEGLQWEFDGWANALDYILDGSGKLGAQSLLAADGITLSSTDEELMETYESERRNANGEEVGEESDTPEDAARREGWTVVRHIYAGTNQPGKPVLAQDASDRLWVVNDIHGPWAILVAE